MEKKKDELFEKKAKRKMFQILIVNTSQVPSNTIFKTINFKQLNCQPQKTKKKHKMTISE